MVKDETLIRLRWLKEGIPLNEYQDLSQRSWVSFTLIPVHWLFALHINLL